MPASSRILSCNHGILSSTSYLPAARFCFPQEAPLFVENRSDSFQAIPHNSKYRYGERGAAAAGAVLEPLGGNCAVLPSLFPCRYAVCIPVFAHKLPLFTQSLPEFPAISCLVHPQFIFILHDRIYRGPLLPPPTGGIVMHETQQPRDPKKTTGIVYAVILVVLLLLNFWAFPP